MMVRLPAIVHLDHLGPAVAEELHGRADALGGHVDDQQLDRLGPLAVLAAAEDHLGLADAQLVAFAPHVLQQDSQVQQPAPETVNSSPWSSTRRATLDWSSLFSRSRSWRLVTYSAFLPGEGPVVDSEGHVQRRLVHVERSAAATGFSGSASVSPISTCSSPTTAQMSPTST